MALLRVAALSHRLEKLESDRREIELGPGYVAPAQWERQLRLYDEWIARDRSELQTLLRGERERGELNAVLRGEGHDG